MRLLDTTTLEPYEFFGTNIPPYAILSHRWGDFEVTFKDLESGNCVQMEGWVKITGCCAQAALDGWQYAWIDSCCIDKSSSAELTEAINSMFAWYRGAAVCYAYLSDVFVQERHPSSLEYDLRQSKWFTRGWTLQELLAPATVILFDHDWVEIGTKTSLEGLISSITGIEHLLDFEKACIAQKMSWASARETLRVEDQAYCLLGLFGVNMPLLYGEGDKAFLRLQTEIIKISDDESIFAWTEGSRQVPSCGLLAKSPAAFKHSGDITLYPNRRSSPYSMTNKGLQIALALTPIEDASTLYRAPVYCIKRGESMPITLYFRKLHKARDVYARAFCDTFVPMKFCTPPGKAQETVFVPQERNDNRPTKVIIHELLYWSILFGSLYSDQMVEGIAPKASDLLHAWEDLMNYGVEETFGVPVLELRTGVALVEYEVFGTVFGVEIHNPTDQPPGITFIAPGDKSVSPRAIIEERLKKPMKQVVQDTASVVLTRGVKLAATLKKKEVLIGGPLYMVKVTVQDRRQFLD